MSPHLVTRLVSRLLGWHWYPGLPPVLVSIAFHISVFSIPSSSLAIGFHSCFFFAADVSAPIRSTLHLFTFYASFQTGSGTRCCCPKGGTEVRIEKKSRSKFLLWPE